MEDVLEETQTKKLKVKNFNIDNFEKFISKLQNISNQVSLKITNGELISNAYKPGAEVVKSQSINLDQIFVLEEQLDKPLKMAFFDSKTVISFLKQLNDNSQITSYFYYVDMGEHYSTEMVYFQDDVINIKFYCADDKLFVDLTDKEINKAFDDSEKECEFPLHTWLIKKINSLSKLDTSHKYSDYMFFVSNEKNGLQIGGPTYRLTVDANQNDKNINKIIDKELFSVVDQEDYAIKVCQNKVLLYNKDEVTKQEGGEDSGNIKTKIAISFVDNSDGDEIFNEVGFEQ